MFENIPNKYTCVCPLCGVSNVSIETVATPFITKLWISMGVDVSGMLNFPWLFKFKCTCCQLGYYYPEACGNDKFYSQLSKWDWYYGHEGKTEYSIVSSLVQNGEKLIDVGCGIGEFCRYLDASVQFTGLELSTKAVGIAKSLGRNVLQLNIKELPENYISAFDFVTCFQVLEHVQVIDDFFKPLVSMCRQGGIICLAVPNSDSFLGEAVNHIMNAPPHHLLHWCEKSLRFLATKYHLEVFQYTEEPIQGVHLRAIHTVYWARYISNFFHIERRSFDSRIRLKFVNFLSRIASIFSSVLHPSMIQKGQSSIIILRK